MNRRGHREGFFPYGNELGPLHIQHKEMQEEETVQCGDCETTKDKPPKVKKKKKKKGWRPRDLFVRKQEYPPICPGLM